MRDALLALPSSALTLSRAAVDFGYILGRDPKPFPPALKLSREMVEAMGGAQSPHYARFKSLCYTAYTSLRKNSNLILNLVALMVDANIPDIRIEPDKAVLKVSPCCALSRQRAAVREMLMFIFASPSAPGARQVSPRSRRGGGDPVLRGPAQRDVVRHARL